MNLRNHNQPLSFVDIETVKLKLLTSEMELINDGVKLRVPIACTQLLPFLTAISFILPPPCPLENAWAHTQKQTCSRPQAQGKPCTPSISI